MKIGAVNDNARSLAKELLGISNLGIKELRLMPYIQYLAINQAGLDLQKINPEEIDIIYKWEDKGWIYATNELDKPLRISKKFWDAIHDILWETYVSQLEDYSL